MLKHLLLLVAVFAAPCLALAQATPVDVNVGATLQAFINGSYGLGVSMVFVLLGRATRAGGALAPLIPSLPPKVVPWGLAIIAGLSTYGTSTLVLGLSPMMAIGQALSAAVPTIFGLLLRGESDKKVDEVLTGNTFTP